MWTLYTQALAAAPSAVHANVINTATNFVIAAVLGVVLFGERLNAQWGLGAGLLIAGTVIIGRARVVEGKEREGIEKKKD
jgi:drug/metabolite transporter (DMT)-like permease